MKLSGGVLLMAVVSVALFAKGLEQTETRALVSEPVPAARLAARVQADPHALVPADADALLPDWQMEQTLLVDGLPARLMVAYDPAAWHGTHYLAPDMLEHRLVRGCWLKLANDAAAPVKGVVSEVRRSLGGRWFVQASVTPAGASFPRQVTYTATGAGAPMAFVVTAGEALQDVSNFTTCLAAAETVLARLQAAQ